MTESGGCPPEAGNAVCELPAQNFQRPPRVTHACPVCGEKGKPVQGQTVKAFLSASLRAVQEVEYLFCKTQTCPVVYFAPAGERTLTVEQVRERVYQKEPDAEEVFVCYCFRHTVGDIRAASPQSQAALLDDINAGINADQCACDLRNPQGSCCLGNVRGVIKQGQKMPARVTH
ncbi:MAG: copper chaperone Copz family protein [Chloroflexi bacterium]|nr:copper chaperone Copz family protein [Chloroflexota bacterium]MBI3733584.1 copper chaperone Copz family protein [Chloroflexota bacterium]